MRTCLETSAILALALLIAACAGPTFAPDVAPEFLVIRDYTPLYRYGPQQGGPPEERLRKDDRVRVLRHEFGFSLVQIGDGQTGYVANEDLAPAPPSIAPPPAPLPADEKFEPLPPVEEPPLPKPDLDVTPTDAPPVAPPAPAAR